MMRAGIYMGWVGRGNLGDEAMYELCKRRYPALHWSSFHHLAYQSTAGQALKEGIHDRQRLVRGLVDELRCQRRLRAIATKIAHRVAARVGGEVGLLGGGTLINRAESNLQSYIDVRKRTRSLVPVFGAGVASPEFWTGRREWQDRRKDWVALLSELPVVGVRGPRSMAFLNDAGARNVVVCGDPAVAFHAAYRTEPSYQPTGRPLRIAINTGNCSGNLWGDPDDIHQSLVGLTQWLREGNHHVEVLPVWNRDVSYCRDLARMAALPESSVSPALASPASFLKKVETFDLVIALKLHAAVLSAAANVPSIVLEYQPKCLDFAASVGWEQHTIRTDQISAAGLIERVESLIGMLPSAKKQLYRSMRDLSQRFEEYCQTIEPMLLAKTSRDPAIGAA